MCPGTSARGQITATGIPFNIRYPIVIGSAQELNTVTPVFLGNLSLSAPGVFHVEINVPKLEFGFACGSDSGKNYMTTSR